MSFDTHISADEGYTHPEPFLCICGIHWADTPELWSCKACETYACSECKKKCFGCDEVYCIGCVAFRDFGDSLRAYCPDCVRDCEENLCRCVNCGDPRTDLKEVGDDGEEICGPCFLASRAA